ncbi:MAG: hypothetical protein A2V69_01110 [Candidatus Portnoybacteria bacterium RBG_13_40_8]|uniref:Uncharacterized protein n=1 Tax=Candidatus Portnoybacteria bacterium RBG_13_40_8 TaxID=1801990 RepID=A0A1G2F3X6_9BACT|nr:MAG: hypothetical protein A2V69_01110 [Candidatus Portnoybacteria bacterium RBG_13_40_8]
MIIEKKLKYGTFSWDDEKKEFIVENYKGIVHLNKTYAYAFQRFLTRISQRNWFRKRERGR